MTGRRDIEGTGTGAEDLPGSLDVAAIPPADPDSVTQLLGEVEKGESGAWNRIYALLYRDLHQIARSQIRQQRRSHVRSPTSLISETWLKLASADFSVENRAHLVALVARAMRFVLLDEVRRTLAEKRGEGMDLLPLDETTEPGQSSRLEQLLILDQALNDLAKLDARLAQVVEMRYFGGLSELEIAGVLKVTERTVRRDWRKARAFLFSHLGEGELPDPSESSGSAPRVHVRKDLPATNAQTCTADSHLRRSSAVPRPCRRRCRGMPPQPERHAHEAGHGTRDGPVQRVQRDVGRRPGWRPGNPQDHRPPGSRRAGPVAGHGRADARARCAALARTPVLGSGGGRAP